MNLYPLDHLMKKVYVMHPYKINIKLLLLSFFHVGFHYFS